MSDKYIWEIPDDLKQAHDANVNTEKIAPPGQPVFYDGLKPRNDQWAESIYGENTNNLMKPIGTFATPEDYLRNYMAINYKEQPGASDYQSFWEDPIKLARYKIAIDNLPPGMEAPSWYNKDAVDKAWAYMSASNPGRYWEEWTPLDPAHPIRSELRELGTPPLEAIPDRDWGSLTPQEIWTSYSDGTNSGLTGAMSYLIQQGLGGQPLSSEAVNTALASYEPGQLDTNLTGVNGLDEQVYQSLPPWKKMLVWMGSSGVAGSAAQAGGIGAAMGLLTNGLGGLVAGGALGAGLGAGASATQTSMPWLAQALNVLDLPAEGLERIAGMITQIGGAAIEDAGEMYIRMNKWGESRDEARSEVQKQEDSLTSILNDLPSAWKASAITYETAGVSLTGGKIDTLEQAESIQLDPEQFGLSALKEARSMIANGASLEDVRAEFANRYGVTGQMYDLAGHVLADPLNLIPAAGLKIGAKIAQKTGNKALELAFKVASTHKGWKESDGVIRTLFKTYPRILFENKTLAAKIPGKFGAWSRHMAGIDLDMNGHPVDHWMTPEGQAEVRKKRLFGLTPEAIAENHAADIALHVGLNINDATTPSEVTKTIVRMSNTDPNMAAVVGDGSWENSAASSAAPVLMRDVAKSLPELQENLWDIHEPDRALFTNLAKASGIDVEDSVALNKFMNDFIKDPDNVLAQVKRALTEAGNNEILAVLNDPMNPVKGIDLKKRAEMFVDGRAVMTLDEYKARVTAYFLDGVEKELVKWFDIKPDKWIFRLGNTIKNTQSMLLLGMNPTYYMNNVINNVVTQAFSGVLGFDGRKANDAFWKRLGIDSPRRLSGVGAADIGVVRQGLSPIAAAKQADGVLSKWDNFARSGNKALPFTRLSQGAEVGASDVATTVAGKKAWYAIHKAGVGFDKMSKPAEQMLRNMGIEPQFIYAAAENGMNIKEIEANLWDEVSYNFLSQVASPDQQKLLQDVGVYDSLSTRLRKAKDARDIDQAFKDTASDMRKHVQAKAALDTVTETAKWYQGYITEGSQKAYQAFDLALSDYADVFSAHQKKLDDFHAGLEKIPVGRRRMLKEQFFAEADAEFKLARTQRDKRYLGVCQAMMGNGSPQEVTLTDRLITASQLHDNFFGSRKRIWQDFFNAYDGDMQSVNDFTDSVKGIIGEERVAELQGQYGDQWMYRGAQEANRVNYRNMNEALDDVQLDIDNLFIEMFEKHYPGGRNAAIAWRAQARYLQQVLVEAEDYFRHGEDGNKLGELGATGGSVKKLVDEILGGQALMDIPNDQRGKYWKQYHQKVKQPLIADQAKASLICEMNIADAAVGKKPVVEQPKVEQPKAKPEKIFTVVEEKVEKAAVKKMEVDLKAKAQADEVRQLVQKPDKYIVNIVNKYGDKKVKSIAEITPEMAQKAMDERARVKAEEVKAVEPVKVEGEVEPAKVEEPEEPMAQPRTKAEIENELAYKAANLDAIAKNAHGVYNREAFSQDLVDVFKLPQEQADGVMAVLDAMSEYWSKRTGKAPERWWTENIAGLVEGGEGQINQAVDADLWKTPEQGITSANTSINDKKIPALFSIVGDKWQPDTINLDIGGGRFDNQTDYLKSKGVENLVYDPFNRTKEHNDAVSNQVKTSKVDTVTISNVLNVIAEESNQILVLRQAEDAVKDGGIVYIKVYPGDSSGTGKTTKAGFQQNKKTRDYLTLVKKVFPDAEIRNDVIVATKKANSLYQTVNQNYFYNNILSDAEVEGYALALSRTPHQIVNALSAEQPKERIRLLDALYKIDPNLARKTAMETKGTLWQGADDFTSPAFRGFFKQSKVVDASGNPLPVYHGTKRADRIADKSKFSKKRATSGPMAFFTDSKELASNYSINKSDTSIRLDDSFYDYRNWFKAKPKGSRTEQNVARLWYSLDNETKRLLEERLPDIRFDEDTNTYVYDPGNGMTTRDHWEYTLRDLGYNWDKNYLDAAVEVWLTSGALYNNEADFLKVLKEAGLNELVRMDDPDRVQPGVFPVYLSIQNPLDTYNIPDAVVDALKKQAKKVRRKVRGAVDHWDKNSYTPAEWIERLEYSLSRGNTDVWTSIPDWVTETLSSLGYDGIKDVSNKSGSSSLGTHTVWIPFEETQVKSIFNRGTWDASDPNILRQQAKGATSWTKDGLAILHALEGKDVSTAIHESAHAWLRTLPGVADDDVSVLTNWLRTEYKYELPDDWVNGDVNTYRDAHEAFARAFEKYLQEGKAPRPELQTVFDSFKQWLTAIYRKLRGLDDVKLTDEVRTLFDKWMGDEPNWTPNEMQSAQNALGRVDGINLFDKPDAPYTYYSKYRPLSAGWAKLPEDATFGKAGADGEIRWIASKEPLPIKTIASLELQAVGSSAVDLIKHLYGQRFGKARDTIALKSDSLMTIIHPRENGKWQATVFNETSLLSDSTYNSFDEAIDGALRDGFREPLDPNVVDYYAQNFAESDQKFKEQVAELKKSDEQPLPDGLDYLPKRPVGQISMFQAGEDSPLVTGTAPRAEAEVFNPSDVQRQDALFNVQPEMKGAIKGGDTVGGEGMLFQEAGKAWAFGTDPNKRYEFTYRVVNLDDLITSNKPDTLAKNPKYPSELQPRDRTRAASKAQIDAIARDLSPDALLEDVNSLDRGPMIVGTDNVVESGNGRVLALYAARRDHPEKYTAYTEQLRQSLERYGLSEADIEGMENPVLVRERVTDVDRASFAAEANETVIQRQSQYETALNDAKLIRPESLADLIIAEGENIDTALRKVNNQDFVRAFIGALPENERSTIMAADGTLSIEGLQRIKRALFTAVYPGEVGERLTKVFTESIEEGTSNIQNVLYSTLAEMAMLEGATRTGKLSKELALADDLSKVVDVYARLKQSKTTADDYLAQISIFGNELNEFQGSLLKYVYDNSRKTTNLRDLIRGYVQEAMKQPPAEQIDMFGDRVTKGEILDAVGKKLGQETEFAGETKAPAVETVGEVVARPEASYQPQTPEATQAPIPPVQSVAGTVDSLAPPPQTSAMIEGMLNEVNPVLNELHMKYLQADATRPQGKLVDRMREGIKKANPGLSDPEIDNLLAQGTKEVQKYIRQVGHQMKGEKLATMKLGLAGRDFAILNYNQRTNFDTYMGMVFPYQFWYTRSMMNWAMRGLDRPAMLANYSRLRKTQSELGREGLPYRLRNKSFIPIPFMPDWMGDGVYFDPYKQVFPFEQFTKPIDNLLKQRNTQVKKAMSILHQWETEGEAESDAVTEALQTQSGDLWKRAMAQADIELEQDIENPFDFATTMIGTSLPLQYAYQLAMGRPERISQLPITRFVQAMTGMANIGGPSGINLEAPIRKAVGLPEMDRYYDYRVNRMLANMAAEGTITAEQASQAIVSKSGPVFEQAQGRVAQMGGWQYLGAPLGVDFFPEGEQIDRALQKEYNNAISAWKKGDDKALTNFFDKYPEYETQMLAWKDEGEQLKRFLISEVWDRYSELPAVHKKQVQEQFGDNFTMAFLNSDTRDYDALDTETITMWAQMLNGFVPEDKKQTTLPLKLADDVTAKAVDTYYADRKAKFGSEITEEVYQSDAYNQWRNAYLAKHPEILEWVTSEQSELYGLPAEIQQQVYQFRAMRDTYYPNIYETQNEYFDLDKETRKEYLKQHPELASYWDFREQMAGQFPKAATYIMSDQAVSNALTDQTPYAVIQITRKMSGQLYRQFMGYLYGNETLTAGAKKELRRLWEEAGEPEGDLDEWLDQAKNSL